jgi:hypothetical protein
VDVLVRPISILIKAEWPSHKYTHTNGHTQTIPCTHTNGHTGIDHTPTNYAEPGHNRTTHAGTSPASEAKVKTAGHAATTTVNTSTFNARAHSATANGGADRAATNRYSTTITNGGADKAAANRYSSATANGGADRGADTNAAIAESG